MLLRAATLLLLVACSHVTAAPSTPAPAVRISVDDPCPAKCICLVSSDDTSKMDVVCLTDEQAANLQDPPQDMSVDDAEIIVVHDVETVVDPIDEDPSIQDASVELGSENKPVVNALPVENKVPEVDPVLSTSLKKDEEKVTNILDEDENDGSEEDEEEDIPAAVSSDVPATFSDNDVKQVVSVTVQLPTEEPLKLLPEDELMQGDQPSEDLDEEEEEEGEEMSEEDSLKDEGVMNVEDKVEPQVEPTSEPKVESSEEESEEKGASEEVTNLISDDNAKEVAKKDAPLQFNDEEEAAITDMPAVEPTEIIPSETGLSNDNVFGDEDDSVVSESEEEDAPLVFPVPVSSEAPQVTYTSKPVEEIVAILIPDSSVQEESDDDDETEEEVIALTSTMVNIISRIREFEADKLEESADSSTDKLLILPDGEIMYNGDPIIDDAMSGKMISDDKKETTQPQQSTASWVILGLILATFVSVLGYAAIRGRMDKKSEIRKANVKAERIAKKAAAINEAKNRKPDVDGTEMKVLSHPLLQEQNVEEFKDNDGNLEQVITSDSMPYIDEPITQEKLTKPPRKIQAPPPPVVPVNSNQVPTSPCAPPSPTSPTLVRTRLVDMSPQVARIERNGNADVMQD